MHPIMRTACRLQDHLTQPLSSPRHGDFRRQLMSEHNSGGDAEGETPVDMAITVTSNVSHVAPPKSGRETITAGGCVMLGEAIVTSRS